MDRKDNFIAPTKRDYFRTILIGWVLASAWVGALVWLLLQSGPLDWKLILGWVILSILVPGIEFFKILFESYEEYVERSKGSSGPPKQ